MTTTSSTPASASASTFMPAPDPSPLHVIGPHSDPDRYAVALLPSPRHVRVRFGGQTVADTTRAVLLYETRHLPVYYIPLADVRQEFVVPTAHSTHCPHKGDARYWSLKVGDRESENALWNYPTPIASCPPIADLVAFYWDRVDAWYEEDEEVYVHPRDPYHRVDTVESSRHVVVSVDGVTVAQSHRPRLLFETGLPTRYYLPKLDVRMDLLEPTALHTRCPYKGIASYWSIRVHGKTYADLVWGYPAPLVEQAKLTDLVCFYNEKVDIDVDGVRQERPVTGWS